MGLELARAFVTVAATTTPAVSAFQNLKSQATTDLDEVSRSVDNFGNHVSSVMNDTKTAILGVLGIVQRFTESWRSVGQAQAATFEETQISFDTMLGSAEETKKTLDALTDFAAKTPFEMPEILQAARGLIQFGERGDDLIKTLNTLGNAASGTSTNFGMVALIFNQIRGVGKLLTQDFRQLSTRGILSLQDIADYYGVATNEAQEMISKGKVGFEDLRKIMERLSQEGGRFANLMERQSHSMNGLQSTLNDAIGILKRTIGVPINEWYKPLLETMISLTEWMSNIATRFPELTAGAMLGAEAFAKLGVAILGANFAMRLFGVSLRTALIGTGIGVVIVALGAALGMLIGPIMKAVRAFYAMKPVQEAVTRLTEKLTEAWVRIKAAFDNTVEALRPIIKSFMDFFGIDFSAIGDLILETLIYVVDVVGDAVLKLATFAQTVSMNWGVAWKAIKMGAVALGSYLVDIFENFWTNAVQISGAFVNTIINVFNAVVDGFADAFVKIGALAENGFGLVVSMGRASFSSITEGVVFLVEVFDAAWTAIPDVVWASFTAIMKFADSFCKALINAFWQINTSFYDVFSIVTDVGRAFFTTMAAGLYTLVGKISDIPRLIKVAATGGDIRGELSSMVWDVEKSMIDSFNKSGVGEAASRLNDRVVSIGKGFADAFNDGFEEFENQGGSKAVAGFMDKVKKAAGVTSDAIVSHFTSPEMQTSLTNFENSVDSLVDSISNSAGSIGDSFSKAFAAINLKPLMEAGDITKKVAKDAYDLFSGLWYTEPELPKMKAVVTGDDNTKRKAKEEEKDQSGKDIKGTEIGYEDLTRKLQDMMFEQAKTDGVLNEAEKQTTEAEKQTEEAKKQTEEARKRNGGPVVFHGKGSSIGGGGAAKGGYESLTSGAKAGMTTATDDREFPEYTFTGPQNSASGVHKDIDTMLWDAYWEGQNEANAAAAAAMQAADTGVQFNGWDSAESNAPFPAVALEEPVNYGIQQFMEGAGSFFDNALGAVGLGSNGTQPLLNENEKQTGYLRGMLEALKNLSVGLT